MTLLTWSKNILTNTLGTVRTSLYNTFKLIRQHSKSLLILSISHIALIGLSSSLIYYYPNLQKATIDHNMAQIEAYSVGKSVLNGYENRHFLRATSLTFVINLLVGSLVSITIPGFLIPFSGILLEGYRAVQWGLMFSPFGNGKGISIWHWLTVLVEGEGFVLAAWVSWLQGLDIFRQVKEKWDGRSCEKGVKRGWWPDFRVGIGMTRDVYGLITLVLLGSAVWEAYEVIYLGTK